MKTTEFRKLIREEVRKIVKEGMALDPDTKDSIEALLDETIVPAFIDDMALSPEGTKLAVDYLIQILLKFKKDLEDDLKTITNKDERSRGIRENDFPQASYAHMKPFTKKNNTT